MSFLYRRVHPLIWRLDAESAHNFALTMLRLGLVPGRGSAEADPMLSVSCDNLKLPNPVGLAAGFDKNAAAIRPLFHLGFGFIEVGTLTPLPQKGQKRPRLFRLDYAEAIINRMGFNNIGIARASKRLKSPRGGVVGVNIGANRDTKNKIQDYLAAFSAVKNLADYITVNISSPNTPGLRDLQDKQAISELLSGLNELQDDNKKTPIFLKLAPDIKDDQLDQIIEQATIHRITGLILSNTTTSRPEGLGDLGSESGGLSGRPLFDLSTQQLKHAARASNGRLTLIGVGGVMSGLDAYKKIRAGANLVQIYSGLIFKGPDLPYRINTELKELLKRDGFSHISEAVGQDL